ncbi:MAG: RNA-binding protein [Thaumarchaeota archaeon]|nr:RNA-binding protein [Nitrososphaerota archaeon]
MEPEFEDSLKGIEKGLQQVLGKRERILKTSRDSISLCSKAIVHIHTGKLEDAELEIREAEKTLKSLRKEAGRSNLSRYLVSPEAEYVEASSVQSIVLGRPVPQAKDLGVSDEGYLMGLLDTVGEVKRLLLDAIMRSETQKAERYFELMEGLYSLLSPFAVFDNVVNGLRRKIDVARMLTEDVRGIMAEEARRSRLISSMQGLQLSIENGGRARRGKATPKR